LVRHLLLICAVAVALGSLLSWSGWRGDDEGWK
jgi:hypothetical protein